MGALILDRSWTIMCPHGGQAQVIPSNLQVMLSDNPALLESDTMLIAGCAFNVAGAPEPCLTIQWAPPALQVTVNGTPVLLQTSVGLCLNALQAPQGVAILIPGQIKVSGE